MRRGSRRSFSGLLITVALHGGIFWAVKTAHSQPQEPLIVPRDFVQAEMVKLGKPRDKFWLPQGPRSRRPPPPPDAIKLSDDPNAQGRAGRGAEARGSEDLEGACGARSSARRSSSALAVPDEPDEGALNGSKTGHVRSRGRRSVPRARSSGLLPQNYNLPPGMSAGSDRDAAGDPVPDRRRRDARRTSS